MNFEFSVEKQSGVSVIYLRGELIEKDQSLDFFNEIDGMLANGANKFVLNLEKLSYMTSSGLNILINLLTKSRKSGGDIALSNVPEKIQQLLIITKLNKIFNICKTTPEAIHLLK